MSHNIGPQSGPQTDFLSSRAQFAIFGGAAGGGKSYALLLEVLRHFNNPLFHSMIFRRNSTHIRNPGGLWDNSMSMFKPMGAEPLKSTLEWTFPPGSRLKMAHLENQDSVYSYQGAQIPLIMWDELTHFDEYQLWYMSSRLRSVSGVQGYMRATCNPDCDSFVRRLIDWWINCDGFPIPERSGKLRWYIRLNDEMFWADTKQELIDKYGPQQQPRSLTFIPSKLTDNKILMDLDPNYLSNLLALPRVERMRLLEGNWDVRPQAGDYFQAGWFKIVDTLPSGHSKSVRFWDRAATEPSAENPDPDSTSGTKMHKYANGTYVISNVINVKQKPLDNERLILNTAKQDGVECQVTLEQEPGGSGVADVDNYMRLLSGFNVRKVKVVTDKVTRALPFSAQCQAGNVYLLKGPWNDRFLKELENFPKGKHDDDVDSASGAFNELQEGNSILDLF